jgi:hypothetical protein
VVSGLALRGAWAGTTPLVLLGGLALWVAALDAAEPLGQEIDHPGRTDLYPFDRGVLFLQHLPVVALVSVVTGLLAGVVALVPVGSPVPVGPALLVGVVGGLLAGCGAVVSVVQGAPQAVDVLAVSTPEIAGMRTVIRTAWPPGLAVIGMLPLLAARAAERGISDPPPMSAALTVTLPLAGLAVLVAAWVRFHDAVHEWMRTAMEQMSPTAVVEKAAAEREAAEAREREALGESTDSAGGQDPDDDGAAVASSPKPKPKPPAPPKPKPADPVPGFRGGTSAKPIGRRRDTKQ